ncbi:MAG: PocR ligand-binding domain-containing protein [bacterium]
MGNSSERTVKINPYDGGLPAWSFFPLNSPTPFCNLIKHSKEGLERCIKSDRWAFQIVRETKKPFIYECHAGLIDGIIPIMLEGEIIALLMFGQFLVEPLSEEKYQEVWEKVKDLGLSYEEVREAFFQLVSVPRDYIESIVEGMFEALNKILKSLKDYLTPEKLRLPDIEERLWLAQQEWLIRNISEGERKLLSLFQWANRESVRMYWSKWIEKELETFDKNPWETKSRIWGVITSLLSHLRIFQASSKINLLEFYSHYSSMVRRCVTREEMAETLSRIMNDLLAIRGETRYRASIVERAKGYILQNYDKEGLCLREVAKALRLSSYYLAHLFKSSEGKSVGEHIKEMRIARARELLEDSELSIIEIALEVGYSDPSYFARLFRKATGLSPAEYRRLKKKF